jgi:4-hydroxybenzoyl-CoA thioesterase
VSRAFTKDYTVRFGEIDHAGVMYYPAIFDRIHRAFEDFWPEVIGRNYARILDGDGIGFPLIDLQSSFTRPFRFGDTLRAEIGVVRVGTRSITFRVRLRAVGDDRVRAEARLVTAVIAMQTFRPVDLPAEYVAALQPYLLAPEPAGAPA